MKKFIVLLLICTLTIGGSTITASAATNSGSAGNITVTYYLESSYLITIPEVTLSKTGSNEFNIGAQYVHIEPGKRLYVAIDATSTLENGIFYLDTLYNGKGHKMECKILVSNTNKNATAIEYYICKENTTIAVFEPENTTPQSYGKLTFNPIVSSTTPASTYTGTIYYIITVK